VREREAKDKQGRRRVRELNKQAESVTTVRRVPAQRVARSQDSTENGSSVYRGRPRGRSRTDVGVQGSGIAR
jgi:hypothetical protein